MHTALPGGRGGRTGGQGVDTHRAALRRGLGLAAAAGVRGRPWRSDASGIEYGRRFRLSTLPLLGFPAVFCDMCRVAVAVEGESGRGRQGQAGGGR